MPLSRRDDLMSWFYSVVEIAAGKLSGPGGSDRAVTVTVKKRIDVTLLCQDLPEEFVKIYKYLNRLKFTQKPDYRFLAKLIQKSISKGVFTSSLFDWEELPRATIDALTPLAIDMGSPESCMYHTGVAVADGGCC
jgi:hypothetical protein